MKKSMFLEELGPRKNWQLLPLKRPFVTERCELWGGKNTQWESRIIQETEWPLLWSSVVLVMTLRPVMLCCIGERSCTSSFYHGHSRVVGMTSLIIDYFAQCYCPSPMLWGFFYAGKKKRMALCKPFGIPNGWKALNELQKSLELQIEVRLGHFSLKSFSKPNALSQVVQNRSGNRMILYKQYRANSDRIF